MENRVADGTHAWREWLQAHDGTPEGLWLALAKKGTMSPTSLTYEDALDKTLCSGVDGQRRSRDEATFFQRFTPRRPRSVWSLRNAGLIARAGSGQPDQALRQNRSRQSKADGRWGRAYAGALAVGIPDELAAAFDDDTMVAALPPHRTQLSGRGGSRSAGDPRRKGYTRPMDRL